MPSFVLRQSNPHSPGSLLGFEKVSVDTLLNMMTTTWDALVAEGNIRQPPDASRPPPTPFPLAPYLRTRSRVSPMPNIKHSKPHCRRTPASKWWINHLARDCPGDGIRLVSPLLPPLLPLCLILPKKMTKKTTPTMTMVSAPWWACRLVPQL